MPLLDHFHPPLSVQRDWSSIHGLWVATITQQLNETILPNGFFAAPHVHLGTLAQVDVTAFEEPEALQSGTGEDGGVATAVWAPPRPVLAPPIDFVDQDVFDVQIRSEDGKQLVAAIELISPSNKDRPAHRQAFVAKCAALLAEGVGLIIVDVVTERQQNLHQELMEFYDLSTEAIEAVTSPLYAVAYRPVLGKSSRVEIWPAALEISRVLPLLPLWITEKRAVPVDLEPSYQAACRSLRIQ